MSVYKKTFGALLVALTLLTGCGSNMLEFVADKNSAAATREAAQILIDSGDYDAAISLLAAACPNFTCTNEDDAQQLAAAYMGAAGLDVLDLIASADTNSDSSNNGTDFTAISELLPAITADNFTKIDSAIELLSNISNPTDDQLLQLSISQLTAAVMAVGLAGGGGFDSNGVPLSCSGDCSSGTNATDITGTTITTADGSTPNVGDYAAGVITDSVNNVSGITSLADSDMSDQVNDLAFDMQNSGSSCSTTGGTPTGSVIGTDIDTYLQYCI